MNTIVCLEPWGGHGIEEYDTGLGNRLIHWATIHYISTLCENCKLIVPKEYWPELEFLYLPDTEVVDVDSLEIKKNFLKLSPQDIENILYTENFSCITNSDYIQIYSNEFGDGGLYKKYPKILESLSKIKFKKKEINQFFQDNFSDCCSIHLRRGSGTHPSVGFMHEYFLNDKPQVIEYIRNYICNSFSYPPENFLIIPDSCYFFIIDQVILNNKDRKIYISSDISEDYYGYYFKKYANNISSKNQYLEKFLNLFEYDKTEIKNYKYSLNQTLINLFDLFLLSHSKTVIMDNFSSWSLVAVSIGKNREVIDVIPYIKKNKSISDVQFKVKYQYHLSTNLKNKLVERVKSINERLDIIKDLNSYLFSNILEDAFGNANELDKIYFATQLYIMISLEKRKNDDDIYFLGWNDAIDNLLKKIKPI